jgi:hypothetical protein
MHLLLAGNFLYKLVVDASPLKLKEQVSDVETLAVSL